MDRPSRVTGLIISSSGVFNSWDGVMGTSPRGRRSTGAYEEGSGGGGVIYMSIARVAVIQDAKEKTSEVSGGAYRWEGVKTK